MKRVLVIGVGGMGVRALELFKQLCMRDPPSEASCVETLVLDGDPTDLERVRHATVLPLSASQNLGEACDALGQEMLEGWFPYREPSLRACDLRRSFGLWRKKALFDFLFAMQNGANRAQVDAVLDRLCEGDADGKARYEICTVASLAGGTGSGAFLPVTLYVKKCLAQRGKKDVHAYAALALPEIYAEYALGSMQNQFYANAYAALTELNIMTRTAHGEKTPAFRLGKSKDPFVGLLFDSEDASFRTPSAAPFSCVFLLDKAASRAIDLHARSLSNFLYSFFCTPIFHSFESELSNRSSRFARRIPFVKIAAAIAYDPADGLMEKLSHVIAGEELESVFSQEDGMAGEKCESLLREYFGDFAKKAEKILPDLSAVRDKLCALPVCRAYRLFDSHRAKAEKNEQVADRYRECVDTVDRYYRIFTELLSEHARVLVKEMLPHDLEKRQSGELSLTDRLMKCDGKYENPSHALGRLIAFCNQIMHRLKENADICEKAVFSEQSRRAPAAFLAVEVSEHVGKSVYLALGRERFASFREQTEGYLMRRTDPVLDGEAIVADTLSILQTMRECALKQLESMVFGELLNRTAGLISAYREMFGALSKEHRANRYTDEKFLCSFDRCEPFFLPLGVDAERLKCLLSESKSEWKTADMRADASDVFGRILFESLAKTYRKESSLSFPWLYAELLREVSFSVTAYLHQSTPYIARRRKDAFAFLAENSSEPRETIQSFLLELFRLVSSSSRKQEDEMCVLSLPQRTAEYLSENGLIKADQKHDSQWLKTQTELFLKDLALPAHRLVMTENAGVGLLHLCRFGWVKDLTEEQEFYRRAFDAVTERNARSGRSYFDPGLSADVNLYSEG